MHGSSGLMVLSVTLAVTGAAFAAEKGAPLVGEQAFGNWHADAPGTRRLIRPRDLPAPAPAQSVSAFADESKRPEKTKPKVLEGFSIALVASGLKAPRVIRVAPNGDVFVADSKANQVRVYRMADDGAKPAKEGLFAEGLHQPYGIAFYPPGSSPEWVYVANSDSIVRFPYRNGDLTASGKPEVIVDGIPHVHHWTRDIVFSGDGKTMYLSVGSGSNVALDMSPVPYEGGLAAWKKKQPLGATWDTEARRADVLAFDPDGRNERIFATGLRNCSGMALQPSTRALWCVVNERDELGDNTPFEYATRVKQGAFYGWPWYYIGGNEDPRHKGARPDLASRVTVPDVLFQAHSAPLGIAFYTGGDFPSEYKG
ncbi:MAG: PQQ-dependent sugar dehydrogenase, partial [Bradyrhizobium sp.]